MVLCEKCFPVGDNEVYCMVPLTPCSECGHSNNSGDAGIKCYMYPTDPRTIKCRTCNKDATIFVRWHVNNDKSFEVHVCDPCGGDIFNKLNPGSIAYETFTILPLGTKYEKTK